MKSTRITLRRFACALVLFGVVPFETPLAAEVAPVLAQQLLAPKASLKVETVLWTRRSDRYTLQVVFPRARFALGIQPIKNTADVTLWLLKADGTAIPTNAVRAPGSRLGGGTSEVAYWVSLSAGEAAVAAAFKIDDEYFIEALQPLN